MTVVRNRPRKVTKADYVRIAEFLRSMGTKPVAIEIGNNCVRIITSEGESLTLGRDGENLDQELAEWAASHGES